MSPAQMQILDPEEELEAQPRLTWGRSRTAAFLVDHGGKALSGEALFGRLCELLLAEGVPLLRASCGMRAMHPSAFARNINWRRGEPAVETRREHGIQQTSLYRDSPVALIHQGAAAVRRRLDVPEAMLDFPIVRELKAEGATDYVCMPLHFTNGHINFISWSTDRAGGFSTEQLGLLWDLLPVAALRLEAESQQVATRDLLNTYLGRDAAEQVLSGNLRRGAGTVLDAVLWFCDLRGFTAMADREPAERVIATLDDYFETMVGAVQAQGGDVLKFIGDGMLAIFRLQNGDDRETAGRALAAATGGFSALEKLNEKRAANGLQPLRVGIALHRGQVTYGNIGGADRLDFTVIGHAVNESARVEQLCPRLGRPLLATRAFQELAPDAGLESVGFHGLRGVKEPQELFAFPYTGDI